MRLTVPVLAAVIAAGVCLVLGPQLARVMLTNIAAVEVARTGFRSGPTEREHTHALLRAQQLLQSAQRLPGAGPAIERLLAQVALQRGAVETAIEHLRLAGADRPGPAIRWRLGRLYLSQGREAEALAEWRSAQAGGLLLAEAQRYAAAGALEEALRWYTFAIAIQPDVEAGYLGRAAAYERMQRPAEAASVYRQLNAAVPDSVEGHVRLASLLVGSEHRPDLAREVLQRCLDRATNDHGCLYYLAILNQQAGRLEEALDQMSRFVRLAPESGDGWVALGQMHAAQGSCREALRMYQNAERLGRHPVWRWLALSHAGQVYRAMGRKEEAEAVLKRAVRAAERHEAGPTNIAGLQAELAQLRASGESAPPSTTTIRCRD